jgi:hypothetical protein
MTEAEWLACADPTRMLGFLKRRGSARKRRLFNVGCCRRVWHLLADARSQGAVLVGEQYVDGHASREELRAAHREAEFAYSALRPTPSPALYCAAYAPALATFPTSRHSTALSQSIVEITTAAPATLGTDALGHPVYDEATKAAERVALSDLFRCIFGNPFRPSRPLPPAVLTWNDRSVPRLAQAIYEDRKMPGGTFDTGRLAILADALLDAGCDDEALMAHCRGDGPHVRGCWAVDLILGKE